MTFVMLFFGLLTVSILVSAFVLIVMITEVPRKVSPHKFKILETPIFLKTKRIFNLKFT